MRAKLWPTGLVGRVGLVLFAAVVLVVLGSTFVFEQAEIVSRDDQEAQQIAEQLLTASRVLADIDVGHRPAAARALSEPNLDIVWHATAGELALTASDKRSRKLRTKLLSFEPSLAERHLSLQPDARPDATTGSLYLADGSALTFRITGLGHAVPAIYGHLISIFLLSCCVLLAALLIVRTLAAPLRMLTRAADAIGHGPPIPIDDTQGPGEVRRVARAFNAMQARIGKLVKDRTESLAAVSHDLRTPIARMKLRTDLLAVQEDKAAFGADLDEMEAMLNDLLAHLRGDSDPEKAKQTDIAALLQTLVDDATDAGRSAHYDGPDHLTLKVRALALKRALSNVVNNALAYGEEANVFLHTKDGSAVIAIEDRGPGIPDAEQGAVFEAFYRGDASRNRSKGGMGLGLAIARQAILREGGTIAIKNRDEGGLKVTITLDLVKSV